MLEEDREPEVGGLERRVLVLVQQQEILRLEVSVHHPHGMARVHDLHDRPQQRRRRPLRVMTPRDDPIEELPAGAQLHHEMHRLLVLVGPLQLDDVGLPREVVHDLDLPPHVLDVFLVGELPLGDGLASQLFVGGLVGAEMGDAELASPQLLAEGVGVADVLHRAAEHGADGGRLGRRGAGGGGDGRILDGGGVNGTRARG